MSDDPPSFHAANCRLDGCDWTTMRTSMIAIYGDLEDHMKDDHGYSEAEWRDARQRLEGQA